MNFEKLSKTLLKQADNLDPFITEIIIEYPKNIIKDPQNVNIELLRRLLNLQNEMMDLFQYSEEQRP